MNAAIHVVRWVIAIPVGFAATLALAIIAAVVSDYALLPSIILGYCALVRVATWIAPNGRMGLAWTLFVLTALGGLDALFKGEFLGLLFFTIPSTLGSLLGVLWTMRTERAARPHYD